MSGGRLEAAIRAAEEDSVWGLAAPKAAAPKVDGSAPDWSDFDQRVVPAGPAPGYLEEVEARSSGLSDSAPGAPLP